MVANKNYFIDFSDEEILAISQAAEKSGKSVEEFIKEASVGCALNFKYFDGINIEGVKG